MKKEKHEVSIVRSSAAEYLTFITATGKSDVNAVYFDENVWLTQKMMGLLYNVETHTINYHLKKIFADGEIDEGSVIRKFRITAADGKSYNTNHYNLSAIIAVGNKVDSPRAVQFRKWANHVIEEFTVKGFAMDDERLKNGGTVLTKDYFKEQLERVREIQKISLEPVSLETPIGEEEDSHLGKGRKFFLWNTYTIIHDRKINLTHYVCDSDK